MERMPEVGFVLHLLVCILMGITPKRCFPAPLLLFDTLELVYDLLLPFVLLWLWCYVN